MKKYLVLLVPLLFLMAECRKPPTPEPNPDPDLPPITQEGKGTIGCYINGKPWVPKGYIAIGIPQFLEVVFDESRDNFFALDAYLDGSLHQVLYIRSYSIKVGNNIIVSPSNNKESFLNYSNSNNCTDYYLDTTKTRILTITKLDKVNHIVSGTFEFTAINNCEDTLVFTKGRFDTFL